MVTIDKGHDQPLYQDKEARPHTRRAGRSEMGRSYDYITCPFCQVEVKVYLWSLAGSGKKCPCGAKHSHFGFTLKDKTP